ncbi:3967_t:CDS:2 [Dentiscutata heterogama]|uniref:3967_t:CDS:1 n=1 Tax=Dentiscutata heterogama TaxID=1316150 RepID=A0ACA9KDI2_9GLOM|nr:3967_t:CDS:2 [Dentiscutata heterogama]
MTSVSVNDHETQILYELQGILHAVDSINRTLTNVIQLTSSGGRLYESQRNAKIGIEELKKIIESKNENNDNNRQ